MYRLTRPIAWLLLAAQLLLAVPAVASVASAASCEMASQATDHHDSECPCCPDGGPMSDCLASCALLTALPPITVDLPAPLPGEPVVVQMAHPLPVSAEPPLKPPPISN